MRPFIFLKEPLLRVEEFWMQFWWRIKWWMRKDVLERKELSIRLIWKKFMII